MNGMQELARQLGVLYLRNQCAQLRGAARGAGLQSSQPHTRIMAVRPALRCSAAHAVLGCCLVGPFGGCCLLTARRSVDGQ